MRLSARAKRLEQAVGAPTSDELFEQAFAKYSRNLERVFAGHRGPDEEPLTAAEEAALRSRGIDGLISWLWYGVSDDDVRRWDEEAAR